MRGCESMGVMQNISRETDWKEKEGGVSITPWDSFKRNSLGLISDFHPL